MRTRPLCSVAGFRRALLGAVAVVSAIGLLAELARVNAYQPAYDELFALLSLSFESNIPTWFATILLFSASGLLASMALLARHTQPDQAPRWASLAAVFCYISLDENVGFHERANEWISGSGPLYFSWIVPGAIAVAAVGVFIWPLLVRLHPTTRIRFIMAAVLYITGALLLEIPLGIWTERAGDENLVYSLIDWVEETLELVGTSWFLVALVAQLGNGPGHPPGETLALAEPET